MKNGFAQRFYNGFCDESRCIMFVYAVKTAAVVAAVAAAVPCTQMQVRARQCMHAIMHTQCSLHTQPRAYAAIPATGVLSCAINTAVAALTMHMHANCAHICVCSLRHLSHNCDHDARYAAVHARARCTQLLKHIAGIM
eukprot:13026-Heterococcus_DN1.PRE.4